VKFGGEFENLNEAYFARGAVRWCTGIRADGRSQKRGLARAITLAVQLTSRLSAGVRTETEQHSTQERKQHPSRSQISVWAASGLRLGIGIGPVPIQTRDEINYRLL
jgi:hypothetical protein